MILIWMLVWERRTSNPIQSPVCDGDEALLRLAAPVNMDGRELHTVFDFRRHFLAAAVPEVSIAKEFPFSEDGFFHVERMLCYRFL